MMHPRLYHYQIQWLYYLAMTLSVSNAKKTSFKITNINRTQNIDTFTVRSDINFQYSCEYFGGESILSCRIRDGYSICVCRCAVVKPRFSSGKEYQQCVEIESSRDYYGYLKDALSASPTAVMKNNAQKLATSVRSEPNGGTQTTKTLVSKGTGSAGKPKSENMLLIIIVACVVSIAVVVVVVIAAYLYQREKKVKLFRERSRNRSRSSQGSTARRNDQKQNVEALNLHKYEYVDELSTGGPNGTPSLTRPCNPTSDADADDCVFVELPSINRGSVQGLTRPWSVAGCSRLSTTGVGRVGNQGYQHLMPRPSAAFGCHVNSNGAWNSSHKTKACNREALCEQSINNEKSPRSKSTGNIHVIQRGSNGYQHLIYKTDVHRPKQHSTSLPRHFEVPYETLKGSIHGRSEDEERWLPNFDLDYQHLRYKRSSEKCTKRRVRVDSVSDRTNLLSRLSQSESCLTDIVGTADEKEKHHFRPRSLSVDETRISVDIPPLSPDDLRKHCYEALSRTPDIQEGDEYEMAHIYQRCSNPELDESDSLGYASAEDLNNILQLPVIEHDCDSEGYARADLLLNRTKDAFDQDIQGYARANFISGTANDVYGADSEGYARADFIPGTAEDIYGADSEGYARADFLPGIADDIYGADSEGYARPNVFTDSGFGPVDDVIDGEGYAKADHFTNTLPVPAALHDGSDSEGYARIELSLKDPLLLGDTNCIKPEKYSNDCEKVPKCSRPLLSFKKWRDRPNMVAADRKRSSGFDSVLDPLTKSSEDHRQDSQPDYMTLEETLYVEGNANSRNINEEENDGPVYMVLDTETCSTNGSDKGSLKRENFEGEEIEDEVVKESPEYMVLEANNPNSGCYEI